MSSSTKNEMVAKNANNTENTHTSTLTVEIPIIPISKPADKESDTAIEPVATTLTEAAVAAVAAAVAVAPASTHDSTDSAKTTPLAAMNKENSNNNNNNNSAAQQPTTTSTTITMTIGNKGKMDTDPAMVNFKILYALTQLCGLTMIVLMGSWIGVHMGGLSDSVNPKLEFNWHPLLMTIGLIFLYGNSILIYRGFRTIRKKTLKLVHAGIHMVAFILTVIALKTVFDSHNLAIPPIPNMYSLHSWLGLSAVILFCLQYVAGFAAYLAPGASESIRVSLMPLHVYFGLFGFVLAIASALMGITEKAIFSVRDYSNLPSSGAMVNVCGVFYVIFGGLVLYMATNSNYKRKPIPEDTVLLTGAVE